MLNREQIESLVNLITNEADIFESVTSEFKDHFVNDIRTIVEHWNEEQKLTTDRIMWSLNFEDVLSVLAWNYEYFEKLNMKNPGRFDWFHDLPKQVQRNIIAKYAPLIERNIEFQDWMNSLAVAIDYTDLSLVLSKDIDYHVGLGKEEK